MANKKDIGKKIPRKTSPRPVRVIKHEEEEKHYCVCCGAPFAVQERNFIPTQSTLWTANNGYCPICRTCANRLYDHYKMAYGGDTFKAIRRMCMILDIYYNESIVDSAINAKAVGNTEFAKYLARCNVGKASGKTYDTTIDEEIDGTVEPFTFKTEEPEPPKKSIDSNERWGVGLDPDDYPILEEHYKMLKKNNPNIDNNQEIFIKDLCNINLMKVKAMTAQNLDSYVKASEQYSKIFTKAGLKTVEEKDNSETETVGVTLATIAKMTPEEFYKDKALYADFDGLGEYYDRNVRRPLENIITGSVQKDPEFHVPDDGEDVADGQEE